MVVVKIANMPLGAVPIRAIVSARDNSLQEPPPGWEELPEPEPVAEPNAPADPLQAAINGGDSIRSRLATAV